MNTSETTFGLQVLMQGQFDTAFGRVTTALKAAGFEIAAQADLATLLAKKIDRRVGAFKVLVVFEADLVHRAMVIAPEASLLLLCNVAVTQAEEGDIEVRISDPLAASALAPESYLYPIAQEQHTRLARVIDALRKE